jgi:hypothetical protein
MSPHLIVCMMSQLFVLFMWAQYLQRRCRLCLPFHHCRFAVVSLSYRCPNLYPCPSLLVMGLQFSLQLLELSSHAVFAQSRPVLRSRPLCWTQAINTPEGRSGLYRNSPRTVRRWRSSVVGGRVGRFTHRVAPTDASTQIRRQCIISAFKGRS